MGYPKGQVKICWTKHFAYAVGLLASDGCLLSDGRHIEFTSKDKNQVIMFKECLGLSVIVGQKGRGGFPKKRYFRVQFGDVLFYRWLISIGFSPKKSRTIGVLKIPDVFFFDFLRGEFDGDGCIYSLWDPYWPKSFRYSASFISGSNHFLQWLRESLIRLVGIRGHISCGIRSSALRFGKSETNILFQKMYPNPSVPYLKRKFEKARRIFQIESKNNNGKIQTLVLEPFLKTS